MRFHRNGLAAGIVMGCLVTALCGGASAEEAIWGSSAAWYSTDPGFEGYWKYCLTLNWDVTRYGGQPHAMSHLSLILGVEGCPGACRPGYFASADTAGVGSGEGGCNVYYYMEFNCKGDPSSGITVPTARFEPYYGTCEPDVAGSAYVCFYSIASPRPIGAYDATLWIKFGQNVASGTLQGVLPRCVPPTGAEPSTWGAIKALFR